MLQLRRRTLCKQYYLIDHAQRVGSTEIFRNCFVLFLDVSTCFIALSELQSLHNNDLNRM